MPPIDWGDESQDVWNNNKPDKGDNVCVLNVASWREGYGDGAERGHGCLLSLLDGSPSKASCYVYICLVRPNVLETCPIALQSDTRFSIIGYLTHDRPGSQQTKVPVHYNKPTKLLTMTHPRNAWGIINNIDNAVATSVQKTSAIFESCSPMTARLVPTASAFCVPLSRSMTSSLTKTPSPEKASDSARFVHEDTS